MVLSRNLPGRAEENHEKPESGYYRFFADFLPTKNLQFYYHTYVEIQIYLSQDSQSLGRDMNLGPFKYLAGVFTIRPRRSVIVVTETNTKPSIRLFLFYKKRWNIAVRWLTFVVHIPVIVPNFFTFNVFTLSGSEQGTFVFRCFLWK
jgi:hypothetical protein